MIVLIIVRMLIIVRTGKTYGIQFLPTLSFLEWDSRQCHIASKYQVSRYLTISSYFSIFVLIITFDYMMTLTLIPLSILSFYFPCLLLSLLPSFLSSFFLFSFLSSFISSFLACFYLSVYSSFYSFLPFFLASEPLSFFSIFFLYILPLFIHLFLDSFIPFLLLFLHFFLSS